MIFTNLFRVKTSFVITTLITQKGIYRIEAYMELVKYIRASSGCSQRAQKGQHLINFSEESRK